MKRQPLSSRCRRSGFALVATLSVLVLLTLVAVAFASLSSISLRASTRGEEMAIARANARMALTLAIGQLQRVMGPDARVCAPASILDGNPETPEIDGINHPRWLGAWESARSSGKPWLETPWTRDDADGGLRDARASGGWSRDQPLTWLVSGRNNGQPADPRDAGESLVSMIATAGDEAAVKVPAVQGTDGRHAWWIADENAKAKIDLADPLAGTSPSATDPDSYRKWLLALSHPAGAVDPSLEVDEKTKPKLSSTPTLNLAWKKASKGGAEHFHDFTVWSLGLPVNVRDARLKRDLTAYLASSGKLPERAGDKPLRGLSDDDHLVGPPNQTSARDTGLTWANTRHKKAVPTFGMLRDWALLAEKFAPGKAKGDSIPVVAAPAPLLAGDDSFDGTNLKPAALAPYDTPDISPVLAEGSLYYNLSTTKTGGRGTGQREAYQLSIHLYPRAAIWNPYNVTLKVPPTTLMLQANGNKAVRLIAADGTKEDVVLAWGQSGALGGTLYFRMAGVELPPGVCAIFSPGAKAEYSETSLGTNLLVPDAAPHPGRAFTVKAGEPRLKRPMEFLEIPGGFQAEDYRMLWKLGSAANPAAFQSLPQLSFVSCALQYGDNREMPVSWNSSNPAPIADLDASPTLPLPDTRTRDGFRLRWFEEHPSNLSGSGSLAGTRHFDIAPLANWNPRAAYTLRSPYENVTDVAPNFFGAYTRDLFDQSVSWEDLTPVPEGGLQTGNPFGRPIESTGPKVAFEIPRRGVDIVSLAQFRDVKLSPFVWHPSFAIGNSLADPRLEDRTDRSSPPARNNSEKEFNGWNQKLIGYANDGRTGGGQGTGQWAFYARWSIGGLPETDSVVYDLSYEVNHVLWDDFFLSTGSSSTWRKTLESPDKSPLPNPRHRVAFPAASEEDTLADLTDFHRAAFRIGIDGAFNVNSTSVDAWTAVLASTRDASGATVFARLLDESAPAWKSGDPVDSRSAWSGRRALDDAEIRKLAEGMVAEVKKRGPFLSLSDFVNRRLAKDDTGRAGTIEAAIRRAGLNAPFDEAYPLANRKLKDYAHPDNIADATRIDPTLMPSSKAWGAPGYLTQADVLQPLGPILSARGDTFTIRAYGDATDKQGKIVARAWCEAVVQRVPAPLNPDDSGLNPEKPSAPGDFGRAFRTLSFRWLHPSEAEG